MEQKKAHLPIQMKLIQTLRDDSAAVISFWHVNAVRGSFSRLPRNFDNCILDADEI